MAHMHVYLQKDEEDGSIEETIASFYDCEEDGLHVIMSE